MSRMFGTEPTSVQADGTVDTAYDMVDTALATRPTVRVCFNDRTAIGAVSRLRERGFRVPEDISATGFDDVVLSQHTHPLSRPSAARSSSLATAHGR